ncbi:MAG: hypothetical protein U0R64_02925 [Candidatus Nanopelagicales bacterium]
MTRRTRTILAAGAAGTLVLTVAPAATAEITLSRSIAGIHLHQSHTTVKRHLGEPRSVATRHLGMIDRDVKTWLYGKAGRRLAITFLDGEVVQVSTRSKRQRTPQDIGVGSTKAEVKEALGMRCYPRSKRVTDCGWTAAPDPGERTTWFRLRDGLVVKSGVMVGLY